MLIDDCFHLPNIYSFSLDPKSRPRRCHHVVFYGTQSIQEPSILLDWFDLLVQILLFIQGGLVSASISSGLGRHQYYLTLEQLTGAVEWQVISEPFGIFGVSLPKLAITILLIKIMGPSKSGAAWLWLLNVALNALSIASTIALFAQCKPSTAVWKPVGNYSCWKPSIVSDIAIAQGCK